MEPGPREGTGDVLPHNVGEHQHDGIAQRLLFDVRGSVNISLRHAPHKEAQQMAVRCARGATPP